MKNKKFSKLWSVVKIVWVDSNHTSGWRSGDSPPISNVDDLKYVSVGYLYEVKKEYITLVQSRALMECEGVPRHIDNTITIPRCAIKEVIHIN